MATDELRRLYFDEGKPLREIAALVGLSRATVRKRLVDAGYELRDRSHKIGGRRSGHRDWQNIILPRAAEIVRSYSTKVTLRQLHYRLVSERTGGYQNTDNDYDYLSHATAIWRRDGRFPDLTDETRRISRYRTFTSPEQAIRRAADIYRRDGQETQDYCIRIAIEKRGIVAQLDDWFGLPFDIPIIPTGGYASVPFLDEINSEFDDRPSVLLYAGDLDPSGLDIFRHFTQETQFDYVVHVALRIGQVGDFELSVNEGKEADTRADNFLVEYARIFPDEEDELIEFVAEHGELFQVELDALDPDDLRRLFEEALEPYHDGERVAAVREQEDADRDRLATLTL